jgi:hypothetical protein
VTSTATAISVVSGSCADFSQWRHRVLSERRLGPLRARTIFIGRSPLGIAAGDIDADGTLDILIGNNSSPSAHSIAVFRNDGVQLRFHQNINASNLDGPGSVAARRLNGDHSLDLVFISGATQGCGISTTATAILGRRAR